MATIDDSILPENPPVEDTETQAESSSCSTADEHIQLTTEPAHPEPLESRLANLMHHENIIAIRQDQAQMMQALELANWKLASLNDISESTFQNCAAEFRQTSKLLIDMKKQLDSIFRRIRHLKAKVAATYPEAYALAEANYRKDNDLDDLDDR